MRIQDMSPVQIRKLSLFIAIVAIISCFIAGYFAARNEMTGTATFVRPGRGSGRSEHVTRVEAPVKFRKATNELWAASVFSSLISIGGFVFYRKLGDRLEDVG
jgi:hypothetical protein